jgi:hypothetical protein
MLRRAVNDQGLQSSDNTPPSTVDLAAARRGFIQSLALGAAGAAILGSASGASAQAAVTDTDILNFALNLEYLEAEFYQRAAFGQGLQASDVQGTGTLGTVSGGKKVQFADPNNALYAIEIANDELAHVRTIRDILGGSAVARPSIDLDLAFTLAARAAGLAGPNDTFDAFGSDANFLLAAFLFEDVGVTAYKGAAPLISDPNILSYAARILAIEGYHGGAIRTILYANGFYQQAQAISNARNSLNGNAGLDQGIGDTGTSNIIPSDASGQVFSRTTQQVLQVVYLNPNAQPTGFFPNGLNGTIR